MLKMIDRERLWSLIRFWGWDQRPLSEQAHNLGMSVGSLSRLLNGVRSQVTEATLDHVAFALRVPPRALVREPPPGWMCAGKFDGPLPDELYHFCANAKCIVSLVPNFTCHVLPSPLDYRAMHEHVLRGHGEDTAFVWEFMGTYHKEVARRREAAGTKSYRLKALTSGIALDLAENERTGWLDELARNMKENWARTSVGICSDEGWSAVDLWVRRNIRRADWISVNIADDALVMFWTAAEVWYTTDPKEVGRIKSQALLGFVHDHLDGPYPNESRRENDVTLKATHNAAVRVLDDRWRLKKGRATYTVRV